jgi:hypothetical protein
MTGSAARPRYDQVAELTRGLRLPLAAITDDHLEILAERLQQAFNDLRMHGPPAVATGTEPEVTALMQARLNSLINEDPLWGQLVLYVGRGVESVSFDGAHVEKRPDLSIVLSGRERRFPLVAEAKIVDAATSRTTELYCEQGIRRFVEGEYAWGSREAFMIGYVRDGSSIDKALKTLLSKAMEVHPDRYLVEALPVPVGPDSSDVAYTRHRRDFVYGRQPPPNSPGPISVWHLWLT